MAHEILPSPHPAILQMRYYGELEIEDMHLDHELSAAERDKVYIMLDASDMAITLPPNFMEHVRSSVVMQDNLAHIAVQTRSTTLIALVRVIGRLTGRGYKLSTHSSREEALRYLLELCNAPKEHAPHTLHT